MDPAYRDGLDVLFNEIVTAFNAQTKAPYKVMTGELGLHIIPTVIGHLKAYVVIGNLAQFPQAAVA